MEMFDRTVLQQLRETKADHYRNGAPLDDIFQASQAINEAFPQLTASESTDIALAGIIQQQKEARRRLIERQPFTLLDAVAQRAIVFSEQAPEEISITQAGVIAIQGCRHLLSVE